MDEINYSKRELDMMLKTLDDKNIERHKDVMKVLDEIKTQTTKTNGRVTTGEVRMTDIEIKVASQKTMVTTAVAIFVVLVIPLIIYSFSQATRCADGSCQTVTNNTINK